MLLGLTVVRASLVSALFLTSFPAPAFAVDGLLSLSSPITATTEAQTNAVPATSPPIHVNRTLPNVTPPSSTFSLPSPVTTAALTNARLLPEQLVPVNGTPSAADNAALASTLTDYAASRDSKVLESFATSHPQSPWLVSVLTNLGLLEYRDGFFSKARDDWEQAWSLGKSDKSPASEAITNRAVAELIRFSGRIGRVAEVKALLAQLDDRPFRGLTANMINDARQSVNTMQLHPKDCFKCGPFAVANLLAFLHQNTPQSGATIKAYATTAQGTSLAQILALANQLGLKLQAAKRVSGTELPLPAIVNWKLDHYGALLQANDKRYLLVDPTFGTPAWILKDALNQEASGYFLIPAGPLPTGWVAVGTQEAGTVWGRGDGPNQQGGQTGCGAATCPNDPCNKKGMAQWTFHTMYGSLNITDTPLVYQPPIGPQIAFSVNYDAMEQNQPATINFGNLGPLWNFSWESTITFDTNDAFVNLGGGGYEDYINFNSTTNSYDPDVESGAVLVKTDNGYERRAPDGSKMVFDLADLSDRLYLTQIVDAQGNAITMTYDSNFRLVGVTDAIGQVTTLTYGSDTLGAANFYLIAKVTDPFGRFASFTYNGSGQLTEITDEIGINSQFVYGASDFIQTLTTPYGATNFTMTRTSTQTNGNVTSTIATEPGGAQQRVDAVEISSVTPDSESSAVVPAGMQLDNQYLEFRNSYFWDRKAMHDAPGDYTKASLTHFLHYMGDFNAVESGVVESTKEPLENRVWYYYQNEGVPIATNTGMLANPVAIGRVLDDGTTQLYQATYNAQGFPTQIIDPVGRVTDYTYAANGIDVLSVQQVNGTKSDVLAAATWNTQHLPLTLTGSDGETNTYTYGSKGQLLTYTDAKNETTTSTYNTQGYLTSVQGPMSGTLDKFTYTYDSFGRVATATDGEGYVLSYGYDALSRRISVTYPDGTSEQTVYTNLSPTQFTDRLGRITKFTYNGLQQLISVTDPLNRVTQFSRCTCGALLRMIDPLGRTTSWDYDIQSRVITKTFPDGTADTYAYEDTTSRLKAATDSKKQVKAYAYNLDNTLKAITYINAQQPTPSVLYSWDAAYPRLDSMQDGIGTTTFVYNPVPGGVSLGANRLAQITGPENNAKVTLTYDPLGRVLTRTINGVAQTATYDSLGRIPTVTNALGAFGYTYQNASNRITQITLPNGQKTMQTFFGNSGDLRLQQIKNLNVNGSSLSEDDYTYNSVGDILTWAQSTDANAAVTTTLAYDNGSRLTSATPTTGTTYTYTYDLLGNRLTQAVKTTSTVTSTATYNAANQIQQVSPALGNDKTYLWDAEDRLVGINYTGTNLSTQLRYDGANRCAQITELNGTAVTSTKRFIWLGTQLSEEHDALDNVTRRFFMQGEQSAGVNYFYTRDHLGSVREMTDSSGALHARYSYDPYGTRTKVSGDLDASFGFTGFYYHAPSTLQFALLRAYDSATGRWISRDPIQEAGGYNVYEYAADNPDVLVDPSGLCTGYVGISGSLSGPGRNLNWSVGFAFDGSGDIAPYYSGGAGASTGFGAGLGVSVGGTNAPSIDNTGGPSVNVSGSAGEGFGGSLDGVAGAYGEGPCRKLYSGGGVTGGFNFGGLGVSGGGSNNTIGPHWNPYKAFQGAFPPGPPAPPPGDGPVSPNPPPPTPDPKGAPYNPNGNNGPPNTFNNGSFQGSPSAS